MSSYRAVLGTILATTFALSGQGWAGWVIDEVVKGGEGGRHQVLVQTNRMKTLLLSEGGKTTTAFILDLDAQTITQVDYERRYYVTSTVQDYVQAMQGAMAGAMKEMQEAMKGLPPEQRKMMEEMMRSQMGQAQACREPRIEVRKGGQQATIAGYPAVRYDVLADGKLQSELWIAKGITAWRELDPRKLEQFAVEMAKLSGCSPSQAQRGRFGADPSWRLASEGYPVRTMDRSGSGAIVEVVKAESRTVPSVEFQPPAGFARKTAREMMGR